MKKSSNKFFIALGLILILCGFYWIYVGSDLLEILPPLVLGFGALLFGFSKEKDKN